MMQNTNQRADRDDGPADRPLPERARLVVLVVNLRSQLLTGFELAAFNLPAQIFGDLPVHRVRHRPSSARPFW